MERPHWGRPASELPIPGEDRVVDAVEQARVFGALFPDARGEPIRVGRFELLRRLGRGGMGEVYVAYDGQLDRQVAIKLLRRERATDEHARQRLLREAQVLARLSHPNVVQIHEAGIHEDQVYLVMELVDGVTLREWLGRPSDGTPARSWSKVLPVMIAAGQGLAAAHAEGLTHRDFKPDNVLVGRDGRVRVLDFGLARPGATDEASEASASGSRDVAVTGPQMRPDPGLGAGARREIALLTEPDQVVGTLAYMSPEQLAAKPVDARSDQFSFCVTLYEALYGRRPFEGQGYADYVLAVGRGRFEEPAIRSPPPRWLRALVRRGLAVEPSERFADMDALLRELSRARGRARRVGLTFGVMLLGSVGAAAMWTSEPPCAQADTELAQGWNDAARAGVREGFAAAQPSYGPDAAERVIGALDERVDEWRAEQRDACEDTRVRQTHPEDLLVRRTTCIERNTTDLWALLHALPEADAGLVEHAFEMVEVLPRPVRCQDLDSLGPEAPGDPEAIADVRATIAEARVARQARRQDEARTTIDDGLARAEATDYGPVRAEALVEAARIRLSTLRAPDKDAAIDMLWRALDLAELHEHRELLYEIWLELLFEDARRGRSEQSRLWARRAEVALERSPGEPRRRLELAIRRGVAELHGGDLEASERWLRQGLEDVKALPESELEQAQLFEALGNTLRRTDRIEEALQAYDRAEQLWRTVVGPEHPYLARHAFNMGLLLTDLGRLDAAAERLRHAAARWTEIHGPESLVVGRAELALSQVAQATGDLDDALAHAVRGQEILIATRRPGDTFHIEALEALGLVRFRRGELQAAHDAWQQALDAIVELRGLDDPDALLMRSNVAETLLGLGEHERAREAYVALRPLAEARAEQEPMLLMLVLKGLGLAELGAGHAAQALDPLRAALELLEHNGGHPLERADLQWALARAEHGVDAASKSSHERAEQAAGLYAEHGQAEQANEVRDWLAAMAPWPSL